MSIAGIEAPDEIEKRDTSVSSRVEIREVIKRLKNVNASGNVNIKAELLEADITFATIKVKEIIDCE